MTLLPDRRRGVDETRGGLGILLRLEAVRLGRLVDMVLLRSEMLCTR